MKSRSETRKTPSCTSAGLQKPTRNMYEYKKMSAGLIYHPHPSGPWVAKL